MFYEEFRTTHPHVLSDIFHADYQHQLMTTVLAMFSVPAFNTTAFLEFEKNQNTGGWRLSPAHSLSGCDIISVNSEEGDNAWK